MTGSAFDDLVARGHPRRFGPGDRVFLQGDPSDSVLAILSGTVKIVALSEGGDERILALRSAGEVIGELGAVDGSPRSADAWALDAVDGVVVSSREFLRHLAEHPGAALAVLETAVARLRQSVGSMVEYGTTSVTARVVTRLAELAESHGTTAERGVEISVAITQTELAQWVGSTRESVARSISELRRAGLIENRGRRLVVLDLDALTDLAAD